MYNYKVMMPGGSTFKGELPGNTLYLCKKSHQAVHDNISNENKAEE